MRANLAGRVRLAWNTARFFLRMLIEYAGTVWLLGLAPFLAHLAASSHGGAYEWVPADLWLFVMVLGGNVAIEAFKDRESDGPLRPLAAVLGVCLVIVGAWAYGFLESRGARLDFGIRAYAYRVAIAALCLDVICRVPIMFRSATAEAAEKGKTRC